MLFTSEFVSSFHPDRYCDLISNTILDECIKQDENTRAGIEVLAKDNHVVLAGELTTEAKVPFEDIVKDITNEADYRWNPDIINFINTQSPDIALGTNDEANGAGDQGMMIGYATQEGPEYMPLAWSIARDIIKVFESNKSRFNWLRSDMKSQVTIDYDYSIPQVKTVVFSAQTEKDVDISKIINEVRSIIISVIVIDYVDYVELAPGFEVLFNPTGKFEIGGPEGDCGVTGRKIVVDQYGGYAPVGGGNLNGKDPTKVDRSAAYMMRYLAKNIVAADLMSDCTIQIAYAIGVSQPVSLNIQTSDNVSEEYLEKISKAILNYYDLSPKGIIDFLDLRKPIYVESSRYGHYGNNYSTWEKIDERFKVKLSIE